jgi:hypothetical protein
MPTPTKKATLPAGQLLINGYMKPMNPPSNNVNTSNDRLANMNSSPKQRRRRINDDDDDDDDDDQPLVPQHSKDNDAAAAVQQHVDGKSRLTAWPVLDTENESDANFAVILRPEQRQPLDLLGDEHEHTPHMTTATRSNGRQALRPKRTRRSPTPPPVSDDDRSSSTNPNFQK